MRVFKNKSKQKKAESDKTITSEITVKDIVSKDITLQNSSSNTTSTENKTVKRKTAKTVCRVIVATPTYFVINKNGEKITVRKKNNYVKGQDILY